MYALRDKENPAVGALTDYFRTREEAEEARSRRKMIDRFGEHPGEEFLEVVEVERESRPCRFCGAEVQANEARIDYCRNCYYFGRPREEARAAQIAFFEEATGATVGVEHTGGGCFWLAFRWEGETDYYVATDGEASLPERANEETGEHEALPRGGWGYVGRHSDDEDSPDYEGTPIAGIFVEGYTVSVERYWDEYPAHCLDDSHVLAAILSDRDERRRS